MYISQDPIGLDGGLTLYSYVSDPNAWVDIFGLAGTGGAYMFDVTVTLSDGTKITETYIGKGQKGRMEGSQNYQKTEMIKKYNAVSAEITASVHSNTGYNNELGKMTENRLMHNAEFEKGAIPKEYLNKIMSGNNSWNDPKNKHLQSEAEEIAKELKGQLMEQKSKNKLCQ